MRVANYHSDPDRGLPRVIVAAFISFRVHNPAQVNMLLDGTFARRTLQPWRESSGRTSPQKPAGGQARCTTAGLT